MTRPRVPWLALALARALALVLPVAACSSPPPAAPPAITLVAITDFHGALDEELVRAGPHEFRAGGAERFAAALDSLRAQAEGPLFVLDGGDLFSGTLISNFHEGEPVVRFYNRIGVDAAAVGNHEFDYGPAGPAAISLDGADPRGAIRARAAQAAFPFLAVNIDALEAGGDTGWFSPSVLLERGGARLGVVGATSASTPTTTHASNLSGLRFPTDTAARVSAEAAALRARGADFVVLTVHDGGICENRTPVAYPSDAAELARHCSEAAIFALVAELPAGTVDAVVAGHTHEQVVGLYRGIPVLQAPAKGKGILSAVLRGGQPAEVRDPLHVCDRYIDGDPTLGCNPQHLSAREIASASAGAPGALADPGALGQEIAELLRPYRERVRGVAAREVGLSAAAPFSRAFREECPLGNLMADLLRDATGTDVAILNNGGLRANLPAGALTYGNIYAVLPFDNRVALVTVSGRALRAAVELGASGRFEFYSWSGLRARFSGAGLVELSVGGQPVDPDRPYTVAFSDFLAAGGSGFAELGWPAATVLWDREPMRDLVFAAARALAARTRVLAPGDYFLPASPRLERR